MANLTFLEKQLIETVLEMNSGLVLDFSNREFEEFMKDVVSYNIYAKYPNLSKAKMLRAFLQDESEIYVGKIIIMLLNYMRGKGLVKDNIKEQSERLYELGEKMLGKNRTDNDKAKQKSQPIPHLEIDYDALNISLLDIEKQPTPQAKGYAFEKYLKTLFDKFSLDPRASYRTKYDQIDGSFILDGNTILIEAKYQKDAIPKNDLILFSTKIEKKSHFPKGLFITYSPVDKKAIEYFENNSSRIIILTVEELFLICERKCSLPEVLRKKFRVLDETGCIYKHLMLLD